MRRSTPSKPVRGLANIVDGRKRIHRFRKVNAVVEATWHDNACQDSDRMPSRGRCGPDYEEREGCSVAEAVAWANSFDSPVTLYLYDKDDGIYATYPHQGEIK